MLRIGICDDVYDARLVLRAALERVLEEKHSGAQFFEFSSGEGLLQWLGNHAGELDLVFLDMEMGELDGMETARRLRAADAGLQLVFVTGYADHVFDGYSVGALGYLMKPPKKEQLAQVLERAQAAWCGTWTGPTSAAAGTPTTAFPSPRSSTLPPTGAGPVRHPGPDLHLLRQAGRGGGGGGGGVCPRPPAVSGAGRGGGPDGGRRGGAPHRGAAAGEPLLPAGGASGPDPGGAGGMSMGEFLWLFWFYAGAFLILAANGFFLYQLCRPFIAFSERTLREGLVAADLCRQQRYGHLDRGPQPALHLPVYFGLFLLCTKGDLAGRLAVCVIFFCLEMSVCALLDSYLQILSGDDLYRWYDVATPPGPAGGVRGPVAAIAPAVSGGAGAPLPPAVEDGAGPCGHAPVRPHRRGAADLSEI